MSDPPTEHRDSGWQPRERPGTLAQVCRLLLLTAIVLALILPFTPIAGKIKTTLKELIREAQKTRTVTKEVPRDVVREVEVPRDVVREVIREVKVPVEAPPPPPQPLPENYIPRKDVDVATFFNGITVKTNLQTEQGTYASLERLDPEAYRAEFQLSVRVPQANQTLAELSRINGQLPTLLPDLATMLTTAKVSGFYHKLYENKTNAIRRDITRLNRILDRHNFFDCETILELTHPASKRRALLIQSEMDVVADGSDGDRMATLDEYIYLSDYYQPFTSYAWAKTTATPNPLLARWEGRLKTAKEQFAVKGLSAQRNAELRALIGQLEIEIKEMKARSSLIADKDPFIVLSLLFRGYSGQNKHTPQMGDYAVVIHEGKMYPAICGDYGPTMKMGEASLFMAKAINPSATPYRRPESDLKVTYLVFPGTADNPKTAPNLELWHQKCGAFLTEIGAPGAVNVLHKWEDPFKKPEPPPVLGGVAPGTVGTEMPAAGAVPAGAPTSTPAPGAGSGAAAVTAPTPGATPGIPASVGAPSPAPGANPAGAQVPGVTPSSPPTGTPSTTPSTGTGTGVGSGSAPSTGPAGAGAGKATPAAPAPAPSAPATTPTGAPPAGKKS